MKEKGKSAEPIVDFSEFNYSSSSDLPCRKHPYSSSVGICSYCLKDKLIKLVCSDCGEQRLSSCSCSDISSSYRNSCSVEVGSVGRVSFLIENDQQKNEQKNGEKLSEVFLLRRSSSSCVEVKRRSNGFWRFGKLFRKKRDRFCERNGAESDYMVASRSRSLCSYRVESGYNDQDQDIDFGLLSNKFSEKKCQFHEEKPRKSGFKGILDCENEVSFKTLEIDRASNVLNRSVFPVKESDFSEMDESAFIDLKLDVLSSESNFDGLKGGTFMENQELLVGSFGSLREDRIFGNGGSCRITVNEREIRKGNKGHKVWRWIFRNHPAGWRSSSKKDISHDLKV